MRLKSQLISRARTIGFDLCRVTSAHLPQTKGDKLDIAIQNHWHASMDWMVTTAQRRKSPDAMWPQARSAVLLGLNYGPDIDPLQTLCQKDKATLSVYARNRDYHNIIKGKLKTLAGWLASKTKQDVKVFVDTAPLMEKPLAEQAGLGWQGKHTNLVSREFGSWLFLGSILTTAELELDKGEIDHCGSCRACLDICPTDAFPGPYQLDARRCISYLTIEHKGPVPIEFRKAMGNRIYGCDDCLAVCPWNKYAQVTSEVKLAARDELRKPDLRKLAQLSDEAFRSFFSASPIKRIGRDHFLRNVLIAMGNSENPALLRHVQPHLKDPNAIVRGAAVWALAQLAEPTQLANLQATHMQNEQDQQVREEWQMV
ncbi:MAG: tRNA epoxyqueuosine(34) reductase QueG [Pseudomonadota bacterium]